MARPLTPSERLVGRRLPALPSARDQLLSGFLDAEGNPVGRATPSGAAERDLVSAHAKLRKERLIHMGLRISFGGPLRKNDGIWYLREGEKPLQEARAARARIIARDEARKQWVRDFRAARASLAVNRQEPDLPSPADAKEDDLSP